MKRILLVIALMFASVAAIADGGPIPMCNPNCECRPGRPNPCTPDKTPRPYLIENVGFNYVR